MLSRKVATGAIIAIVLGAGAIALTAARRNARTESIDFEKTVRATTPAYDAASPRSRPPDIKEFRIPIKDATIQIANGVTYQGWTFGGTVPGPVLRVRVGDRVRITVVNEAPMAHSIDFHAAQIPWNVAYRVDQPARLALLRVHAAICGRLHGALRHATGHAAHHAGDVHGDHRRPEETAGPRRRTRSSSSCRASSTRSRVTALGARRGHAADAARLAGRDGEERQLRGLQRPRAAVQGPSAEGE